MLCFVFKEQSYTAPLVFSSLYYISLVSLVGEPRRSAQCATCRRCRRVNPASKNLTRPMKLLEVCSAWKFAKIPVFTYIILLFYVPTIYPRVYHIIISENFFILDMIYIYHAVHVNIVISCQEQNGTPKYTNKSKSGPLACPAIVASTWR